MNFKYRLVPGPITQKKSVFGMSLADPFCDAIKNVGLSCGDRISGLDSVHNNRVIKVLI